MLCKFQALTASATSPINTSFALSQIDMVLYKKCRLFREYFVASSFYGVKILNELNRIGRSNVCNISLITSILFILKKSFSTQNT